MTDDGVRLWVNNQLIIDKWIDQGPTEWSGQIALTAGQRYNIRMEFYENGGGATAKLLWSSASQPKVAIAQSQLYPAGSGNAQVDLQWLVSDQLGTSRMIIDQTGSLSGMKRHDYLPFGEEIPSEANWRTIARGYVGDNVRQEFTQKERDNETGLDYFEARYYASIQGRFTSPDEFWKDSVMGDPQSWNKYAYVRNNPLVLIDPTGEKAKVTVEVDPQKKTGTITIAASFAVYSAPGQKISKEDPQKQADLIKKQLESTYSGSFTRNGITFTVSANITANVVDSKTEAETGGRKGTYDNIVEVGNRDLMSKGSITRHSPKHMLTRIDIAERLLIGSRSMQDHCPINYTGTNLRTYLDLKLMKVTSLISTRRSLPN